LLNVSRLSGVIRSMGLVILIAVCPFRSQAQEPVQVPPAPLETSIQQRLNLLEETNQKFSQQLEALQTENDSLTSQLKEFELNFSKPQHRTLSRQELSLEQPPDIRTDEPYDGSTDPGSNINPFEEALVWGSDDGEWTLNFHNETQLDIRTYAQHHSSPVNQVGFYIPRMRMIFNGRLTKPIEYNISINKGLGSLDLLDAYLNLNYDPRFQVQFGRYRVPFTYDWYALSNQFLSTPERSVFALNLGYNRNVGAMLHGELLEERVDYAVAVVNGPRNSYYDSNSAKDVLGYVNIRPFHNNPNLQIFRNLNVGASVGFGHQNQNANPVAFRTSTSASGSAGNFDAAPSFLELNDNVREMGQREQWEVHLAYYYKQLTVMAALDRGLNTYGFSNAPGSVPVHAKAWHAQFGYFLTGEEIRRRTFVDVLRPFDLRAGKRGPGAWELQARYDHFQLSSNVFTGGLADSTVWTNSVNTVDVGLNWYLNRYIKIDFDWQHCSYGDPVQYAPGKTNTSSDLFWVRFQNYF